MKKAIRELEQEHRNEAQTGRKTTAKCPECGRAALRKEARKSELYGFDTGEYTAEVCPSCGEIFWQEADIRKMEEKAKKLGIWGLEHLKSRRLKPSDFAGAWKVTDEELDEIMKGLKESWSRWKYLREEP